MRRRATHASRCFSFAVSLIRASKPTPMAMRSASGMHVIHANDATKPATAPAPGAIRREHWNLKQDKTVVCRYRDRCCQCSPSTFRPTYEPGKLSLSAAEFDEAIATINHQIDAPKWNVRAVESKLQLVSRSTHTRRSAAGRSI